MMAVYDTLISQAGLALLSFTGDNTVNELNFSIPANSEIPLQNGNGDTYFEDGDQVKINKIRTIMPYMYGRGNYLSTYTIALQWKQGAVKTNVPEFGDFGILHFNNCGDLAPGVHCQAPNPGGGRYQLLIRYVSMRISQINAPASLNGVTLYFGFQMEVEHTIKMWFFA